jgi:hypothetical protein
MVATSVLDSFRSYPALSCTDLSEYDEAQVRTTLHDSLIYTTESWDVEMVLMQEGRTRMLIEGSYAISYHEEERKHTKIDGPVYVQIYDSLGTLKRKPGVKEPFILKKTVSLNSTTPSAFKPMMTFSLLRLSEMVTGYRPDYISLLCNHHHTNRQYFRARI